MHRKTALKWMKNKKQKQQTSDNTTIINFKTHSISESQNQIIVPKQYPQFLKFGQILIIECGKQKILVQVGNHTIGNQTYRENQERNQISVLKSLLDLHKIQCDQNGMFKGEIRILNQSKICEHSLEIVEFLVKETYFSRRDQYKVTKALRQFVTHAYLKKTIYFDEIGLEVIAMLKNNQNVAKSGLIDKNTKLIFRTNCSKLSIAIELSIETFQLNENKELYLEKMIEFLNIFFHRNAYFHNSHKLTLILYARLFYPQFINLNDAYNYLAKSNSVVTDLQKFQVNFSVALQKDYKGRIYQDVYRRIFWSADMIDNFRQFFWEKISQFLFTLNWDIKDQSSHIGKFITKSLERKVNDQTLQAKIQQNRNTWKVKPFVHKLKGKLSESKNSNIFETISLISQQYKHHYKFRSVSQTGNTIILLSAGNSVYQVDELTYKMAKNYVYLTNIYCSFINFNKKLNEPVKVQIYCMKHKPIYEDSENCKKIKNILLNCIQKQVYNSPMNEGIQYWQKFQVKNMIYPDEIFEVEQSLQPFLQQQHQCDVKRHSQLRESSQYIFHPSRDTIKYKDISFMNYYTINNRCLYIHEHFYQKLKVQHQFYANYSKEKGKYDQLKIFQSGLDKIIINKTNWNFENQNSFVSLEKQINSYIQFIEKSNSKQNKSESDLKLANINNKLFGLQTEIKNTSVQQKYQTTSNIELQFDQDQKRIDLKYRKNSQYYQNQFDSQDYQLKNSKDKVNIFEITFKNKNHEYNAKSSNQNRAKKVVSHNKQRSRNNHLDSNIHYLMPHFNQNILKKFNAFIKKQYIEQLKEEQESVRSLFEMEKFWKNICFPLLTPIYTKYKEVHAQKEQHFVGGLTDQNNDKKVSILQDEICMLLMKNYQIQQTNGIFNAQNALIQLSKGHVSCHLKMIGNNLNRSYLIDKNRQAKIIPFMLYRYLCYEDKDYRFCSKYIYFEDKNFYDQMKQQVLQTKTVKIVLAHDDGTSSSNKQQQLMSSSFYFSSKDMKSLGGDQFSASFNLTKRDPITDFIKMFNDKYKQCQIQVSKIKPKQIPKRKKIPLNFSKKQSRALYHHQQIYIEINTQYNLRNLFQIQISWNLCSSVLVSEFSQNIMTMGRRSKLKPYLTSAGNIFETVWSITTLGQIIFESRQGLDLLQNSIIEAGEWLWDSNDYYMHLSGIAFINFKKDKKLILWRDNNNEKRNRDIKKGDSNKRYNEFFMRAAVFDILGTLISKIVQISESK